MKKILVFTPHFHPENQIINDFVFSLKDDYDFTIVTSFPNYPDRKLFKEYKLWKDLYSKKSKNIKIIRLPVIYRKKNNLFFLFLNYLTLLISSLLITPFLLLKRYDYLFIYLTSPIFVAISPFLINFFKKTKMSIWVLDLWPETLDFYKFPLKKIIKKIIFNFSQRLYSKCTNIFISSQGFSKSSSLKNFKNKIIFSPQWNKHQSNLLKTEEVFNLPKIQKEDFIILFAGNMGKAQNLNYLFEAIKTISKNKNIKWFFVGDGSESKDFQKKIYSNKLQKNVYFFGHVPYSKLDIFFKNSNAFLISLVDSPSINKVLPSRINHFLSYGKPILTLSSGEVSEFVQKHHLGLTSNSNEFNKLADNIGVMKNFNKFQLNEIKKNSRMVLDEIFNKEKIIKMIVNKSFS